MPDDSLGRVDSKNERIMSESHSVPEIFDVKYSKNALRHNYNHYVIIRACSAYSIFIDISKKLMKYFHYKKLSEFCSSRRFQRRTTFRDILEKKIVSPNYGKKMQDDSPSRVDSKVKE